MTSMREAMKRLQVIYEECAPEAAEHAAAEKGMDEFTRLKKKIHQESLKEREELLSRYGTTSQTAEAAYRVRVMIRTLKENVKKLDELVSKQEKKKGKKKLDDEELSARRETVTLCNQHIEELDNLEKRRYDDQNNVDRTTLFTGASEAARPNPGERRAYGTGAAQSPKETNNDRQALFEGATGGKKGKKKNQESQQEEMDPFMSSALPDIDEDGVEEDFRNMNEKNIAIDDDIDEIGKGVSKLKEIALDMNNELEAQGKALDELDVNVDKALDGLDNVNIKMKTLLNKAMKPDKFMVNCILICLVLALVAFIANLFF